ncbi:RcnB family protein [Flavisphingomonas formosensis]|uniref:RcnB family protein n=1 Tax=Flavisphingomonas formosensis TaxID=861534 RepID=UPI0012FA2A73|nr:RcnB family protein [Sphingomonas formosensis]
MRKFIILGLIAATAVPSLASAQSAGELRHDRHMIHEEQRQLNNARRGGDPREIREQQRDVREARREYREDWRDYRQAHRDVYRRGAYVGPRGYAYRPVPVGYRFAPRYYHSRYWISDPWTYRLPRVAGPQRWIRYGNDVVLVNIRTGRVITVHRDFFW